MPETLTRRRLLIPTGAPPPDDTVRLVSRTSFGPRSVDVEAARRLGREEWLEQQLDYPSLDDRDVEALVDELASTVRLTSPELADYSDQREAEIEAGGSGRNPRQEIASDLVAATILRAIHSPRQLYEVMVEFWTNHFSISQLDGLASVLKTADDRDVVRRHALGNFRDLLHASAKSPAMLFYLDNHLNISSGPNENYARELMELHTIGPDAFTQQDVEEVARCFTGWSISGRRPSEPFGLFSFRAATHDGGPRTVLGAPIPSGGMEQGEAVLDRLFDHPGTAQLVCRKLVQRFVSDRPPQALVDRAAEAFRSTEGDIPAVLRTILLSAEFEASDGGKLKRPFEFVVSVARGFDLPPDTQLLSGLAQVIAQMGQRPFGWPAPNGYPDSGAAWANTAGMLRRWNFGLAFEDAGRFQGIDLAAEISAVSPTASAIVDHFVERLLHRSVSTLDRETMIAFVRDTVGDGPLSSSESLEAARRALVLVLDSPYFHSR
ncbi:MAG: DUF1800 domain-containing protein [Acidobacteriota bacterium]